MTSLPRSHFAASLLGGAVVAVAFVALGLTGHGTTETVIQEGPVQAQPASSSEAALTPHQIYVDDAPGVVFVRAQVIQQVEDPFDLFPQQESSISTGSGFLIDKAGHILTNYHVIEGADGRTGVTVQFADNVSRQAVLDGEDPNNDLAVLKVDMNGVPPVYPLALGDSTTVRVGDPTLAIGNPFGLDRTLTGGIVSALQRQIQAPDGFAIDNVIQTDAPINPGNSGGPLIDGAGRVIGINSQIETGGGGGSGSVGIAFAVPINTAEVMLDKLRLGNQPLVAYLGINGVPARPGVRIVAPRPGSPAASAGLKTGDVIRAIGGRSVATMNDVEAIVASHLPGDRVVVQVRRARRTRNLTVRLGTLRAPHPAG
jgi:putative serine protease PepD